MRTRFGTRRRLFIAFALLVSMFGLASYLTLAEVRTIDDDLLQTKHYEDGVRASLELSSAVRDQYAHLAHTIILENDSHVMLYAGAHRHVLDPIPAEVRQYATLPDERTWVDGHRHRLLQARPCVSRSDRAGGPEARYSRRSGGARTGTEACDPHPGPGSDLLVDRFRSSISAVPDERRGNASIGDALDRLLCGCRATPRHPGWPLRPSLGSSAGVSPSSRCRAGRER